MPSATDSGEPLSVGMAAATGVAVTYGLVQLLVSVRGVLILIGLALFLAVGMEPAVSWLVGHRFLGGSRSRRCSWSASPR